MRNCYCCNNYNPNYINTIKLNIVNDIKLGSNLQIYFCNQCNFYYSDSNNTQLDYNNYYKEFNNYKKGIIYSDKDERCYNYLKDILKAHNINSIIDYGSGNGKLYKLLSDFYSIEEFDIGMEKVNKKYDCLILSHVLEHIYDLTKFIDEISSYINNDGILYIEIPNAEYYDKINDICPLQEINIEHINFFSKFALSKLLMKHNFYPVSIIDDYFIIKESKYFIIRGLFKKNHINQSFIKYLDSGCNQISNYNFSSLKKYEKIFVYGCGQFLFKIFDYIKKNTIIVNIIDDNPCYKYKNLDNVDIIDFEKYKLIANKNDIILLTSIIHDKILNENITKFNPNITILSINNL